MSVGNQLHVFSRPDKWGRLTLAFCKQISTHFLGLHSLISTCNYIVMPTTDELRYLADFKTHCTLKGSYVYYAKYDWTPCTACTRALQHHACYI